MRHPILIIGLIMERWHTPYVKILLADILLIIFERKKLSKQTIAEKLILPVDF